MPGTLNKRIKYTLTTFLGLSLLFHIFLTGGVWLLGHYEAEKPKVPEEIEITMIDPSELASAKEEQRKQVVDQSKKALNDETPENSQYLSRNNQRVKKETVARKHGDFNNSGKKGPTVAKSKKQAAKSGSKAKPVAKKTFKDGLPSLDALKPKFDWQQAAKESTERANNDPGQESQTNDYLKNKETGPQTLLNTREFVYFSYYNRIRSKIRQHWEPMIRAKVMKVFAQGRSIASARDRITKVIIVLNPHGSLINVKVIGQSGITDLDDAAIEAFRAAEPFPNPPKGIVEGDGTIKIRWDFVLEA